MSISDTPQRNFKKALEKLQGAQRNLIWAGEQASAMALTMLKTQIIEKWEEQYGPIIYPKDIE